MSIIGMEESMNLEELSAMEMVELSVFIGSLVERFQYMTKKVEAVNQRRENFIKNGYARSEGAINSEYS